MRRLPILLAPLAVVGLLSVAQPAAATVIFSDDFNAENGGVGALNYTGFANWGVSGVGETVDLIGNGFFDFYPGNGLYVDLDGSTGNAGVLTTNSFFGPGSYVLSFNLAGSTRGDTNTVIVRFGGVDISGGGITLGSAAPFNPPFSLSFNAAGSGPDQLRKPRRRQPRSHPRQRRAGSDRRPRAGLVALARRRSRGPRPVAPSALRLDSHSPSGRRRASHPLGAVSLCKGPESPLRDPSVSSVYLPGGGHPQGHLTQGEAR